MAIAARFFGGNRSSSRESLRGRLRENVGRRERGASTVAGGFMVLDGIRRRGVSGLLEGAIGASLLYRGSSGFCWLYNALNIDTSQQREALEQHPSVRVQRTITIDRDPQTVYAMWKRFENLPRFLEHVENISPLDGRRFRWLVRAPSGRRIEWNAEIVEDVPGHHLAWRSEEGAPLRHSGAVGFLSLDGGRATELKVSLQYEPSGGGALREVVSRLLGEDPRRQIRQDLERFKRLVEHEGRPDVRGWEQESPRVV
jgi:uncharacterized membrane protein